jgi:ABC-type glycerol-3-phosphate transport system substrate-binding protein
MKQALAGKNPPDLLNWWSKYRLEDLVSLDLVEDLTDIWEKHINAGEYDRSVINEFMVGDRAYGFMYISMFWTIMYNKNVFQRFNLEEPETWDEFMAICETLKKGGVTPIATTAEGRWYSMAWFEEVLIRTDPDVYEGVLEREIPYSDPRVKKAMGYWKDMIDKEYFPADVTPGFAEVIKQFAAGDIAMYLIGDWAVGNFQAAGMEIGKDVDFFICPNIDPKAGKVIVFETAPLCIAKNSPNKEAARKLADYWLSPEAQTTWASIWVHATTNLKATQPDNAIINKFDELGLMSDYRFVTRFYEGTPVPICEYALDKLTEFMLHPDRMDSILADIDKYIATQ